MATFRARSFGLEKPCAGRVIGGTISTEANVRFRPKPDIGVTLCQASLGACGLTDLAKPAKSVRWKRYCTKIGLLDAAGNVVMLALCAIGWRKAPVTAKGY